MVLDTVYSSVINKYEPTINEALSIFVVASPVAVKVISSIDIPVSSVVSLINSKAAFANSAAVLVWNVWV